jgi:hypothetical protein
MTAMFSKDPKNREVKLKTDKRGRRMALLWNWSQMRYFRISLDEAELGLACGRYIPATV